MLQALRDGAGAGFLKFFLMGILVMAVGGLVLTDVGGFFRGGVASTDVVKAGPVKISATEFDTIVRRVLSQQQISPQDAYRFGMINNILSNEVQFRLLSLEAMKLGLRTGNDAVANQIAKLVTPYVQDGANKSDVFKRIVRSQGLSEEAFIASIRQELQNTLLRSSLLGNSAEPPKALNLDLYTYQNETRTVQGFLLTDASVKLPQEPTEDNLKSFYDADRIEYVIPETRKITLATLQKEMLESRIEITDEELRDAYEDNIAAYENPERRTLEQAVLATQTDAESIFKKVNDGQSLKKATQTVTGNDNPYLAPSDFEQSGLLEEIANPVFDGQENDLIGPVQTALGWHVIRLSKVIPPEVTPFEDVKDNLKDSLLQDRLLDDLLDVVDDIEDRLASGEELEIVVNDFGLTTEAFGPIDQTGKDAKGNDVLSSYDSDIARILSNAFEFDAGETAPLLELADGRFVAVHVNEVNELSYEPFEKVKKDVEKRWKDQQRKLLNKARADDAFSALKENSDLNKIAKELGTKLSTYKNLKRTDDPQKPLSLNVQQKAFNASEDSIFMGSVDKGYFIGKVTDITLPNTDNVKDSDLQSISEQTAREIEQEVIMQYLENLSSQKSVKINERLLQQMYGPNDSSAY